jgi:hypothetical protein
MRGCDDTTRIDGLELLGILEDVCELLREQALLVVGELEVRERRDPIDIGNGEGHGVASIVSGNAEKWKKMVCGRDQACRRCRELVSGRPSSAGGGAG